jgi:hypothetical protein
MTIAKIALATLFCAGFLAATPAAQAEMRTVGGQAYWTGDPGPVEPGAYWASGQYKYDPSAFPSFTQARKHLKTLDFRVRAPDSAG